MQVIGDEAHAVKHMRMLVPVKILKLYGDKAFVWMVLKMPLGSC